MTFTPTQTEDGMPAVCFCCGAEATGIGLGGRAGQDPKWLCEECVAVGGPLYTAARRGLTAYEKAAVARAVDAVGPMVEQNGTDLADWDTEQVQSFIGAIWQACGRELRAVIQEGVGPW